MDNQKPKRGGRSPIFLPPASYLYPSVLPDWMKDRKKLPTKPPLKKEIDDEQV